MSIGSKILQLTKSLYPTGRAFKMPKSSFFEMLHQSLALSEERAYNDAHSILDSIIPDNDGFTIDDTTDWERRLGLITNPATLLVDRESAILRKMNHPGSVRPRENWKFIQEQIQLAGFDVWVFENRFFTTTDYPLLAPTAWTELSGVWTSKTSTEFKKSGTSSGINLPTSYQPCVVKSGNSITISFSLNNIGVISDCRIWLANSSFVQVSPQLSITGSGSIVNGTLTPTSDASYLMISGSVGSGVYNDTITLDTPIGTVLSSIPGALFTKTPAQFSNIPLLQVELGDKELGDFQLGTGVVGKIANSLDESIDNLFDLGGSLRSTFFLGAENPGDWANVPVSRKTEFRQLILKLKPTQSVGFTLINYV